MQHLVLSIFCATAVLSAQSLTIPDGTKLRVRLDQTISSATADEGQTVELSVTDNVKVNDTVVIPEGARVTGTITDAHEKRRMGRAGKLDFSIDRVRAVDGEWIPLRYTLNKKSGESHATRNGIITAGVAVAFWPAAPFILLAKGKDVTINKGVILEVFTDSNHVANLNPAGRQPAVVAANIPAPAAIATQPAVMTAAAQTVEAAPVGAASVAITSAISGADIEVNGAFVGSTPTTLRLAAGTHAITVRNGAKVWQRMVQVTPGSNVSINANFMGMPPSKAVSN